jgi:hypothetical protein
MAPDRVQVKITVPDGCSMTSRALLNETSVSLVDQLGLGHPACVAVAVGGVCGAETLNARLPFLMSPAEIVVTELAVNGTLFFPGDSFPPGLTHAKLARPSADNLNTTSALPRPANEPLHWMVVPLSRHSGVPPCLKCGDAAVAAGAAKAKTRKPNIVSIPIRRVILPGCVKSFRNRG